MADDKLKSYPTLEALVEENLEAVKEGKLRPYKVCVGELGRYVLANSAGNAALAMCKVTTCTQKQIQTAALNALLKKAKSEADA